MAEALYRKYRPQVFEDVVGQEPIERTLKNAIEQDKVSHAYLFCGPRGTGKTTTARLLAKALLCKKGPTPEPDGTCEDCWLIADGVHPDVYELDAASRTGVDNVREEIISRVQFAPTRGRYKVYIIDEVHMLSTAAFNALLKTLEEPPSHVVFVLCTTDPQKVPETIHSRCQRFDFHRIAPESMVARLGAVCVAENVEFEGEALDLIAHRAEGGLRNALTSLEQIIAFENGKVTLAGAERLLGSIDSNDMAEIMAYIGTRDIASCFRWTAAYVETGADLAQFVRDMAEHARNLYVLAMAGDEVELDVGETTRHELATELQWFGSERASRLLGVLGDLSAELRTSSNPRLAFEIALTRMVRPDSDLTLEALAERVEALEAGYSSVAHVLPGRMVGEGAQVEGVETGMAESPSHAVYDGPSGQVADPAEARDQVDGAAGNVVGGRGARQADASAAALASSGSSAGFARGESGSSEVVVSSGEASDGGAGQDGAQASSGQSPLENPAAMQRVWQAALSRVRKEKQAYGVLFLNTKASFDAASGMVRVIFPADSAFAFNAVQKPDVQDALSAALKKAAGYEVAFCYEQAGSRVQTQAAQQPVRHMANVQQPAHLQEQPASVQPSHVEQPNRSEARPASAQAVQQATYAGHSSRAEAPQPNEQAVPEPPRVADASYDQVPYEDEPYDEVPYEPVPYDDYDAPTSAVSSAQEATAPAKTTAEDAPGPAEPRVQGVPADADTGASPSDNRGPDGALAEDPADLQAMLQAGFGGDVVFSEVDE